MTTRILLIVGAGERRTKPPEVAYMMLGQPFGANCPLLRVGDCGTET